MFWHGYFSVTKKTVISATIKTKMDKAAETRPQLSSMDYFLNE